MVAISPGIAVEIGLEDSRYTSGLRRAAQQADQFAAQTQRSAGQMRSAFSNVGFQVQDLAVQIAGGTSAARALSQQLPQLLAGFGGIGVAAGTAATLVISLGAAFFGTGQRAKELGATLRALESVFADVDNDIDKLIAKFAGLDEAQRRVQNLAFIEQQRRAAVEIGKLDEQIAALVARVGSIGGAAFNPLVAMVKQFQAGTINAEQFSQALARVAESSGDTRFQAASAELADLLLQMAEQRQQIDAAVRGQDVLNQKYRETADQLGVVIPKLKPLGEAYEEAGRGARSAAQAQKDFTETLRFDAEADRRLKQLQSQHANQKRIEAEQRQTDKTQADALRQQMLADQRAMAEQAAELWATPAIEARPAVQAAVVDRLREAFG